MKTCAVGIGVLILLAIGAAPKAEVPEGKEAVFDLKGKWAGSFSAGNRVKEHNVEASVRESSGESVTLRFSTGEHGSRDWKMAIAGTKVKLISCVASRSASDTEIKDVKVSGEFALDENGQAKELVCSGEWVFQSKRAGGTERVRLAIKRVK